MFVYIHRELLRTGQRQDFLCNYDAPLIDFLIDEATLKQDIYKTQA